MAAQSTNPARGMRDFLPVDVRKREYVIRIIKEVYESYGFEPLETPAVENLETLTGKYGEEGNQLIFKILKRGEKLDLNDKELADLALRYDLTVPLARVVANYKNDLPKFFKRYQIQPVWRADRPARGRFREFYQCDVDTIGSKSMLVEAEQIAAVCEILERLGFKDFVVRVNHREILFALLRRFEVPDEKHQSALIALDKIDKIGRIGVEKELAHSGISDKVNNQLLNAMEVFLLDSNKSLSGKEKLGVLNVIKSKEILETRFRKSLENMITVVVGEFDENSIKAWDAEPRNLFAATSNFLDLYRMLESDAKGFAAVKDLQVLWGQLMAYGIVAKIVLDPTLARGLSYYTGTIMEVNVPDLAGSLAGGGRYDNLIGMFGKEEIPACGFSLGLERILVVMEEGGMFPPEIAESKSADVMVTIWNEDSIGESLKLASDLRGQRLRVLVYPEAEKLGKQFKYADSINIPFVCVLGESELAAQQVTLKNMKTGEQESVKREKVAAKIVAEARTK